MMETFCATRFPLEFPGIVFLLNIAIIQIYEKTEYPLQVRNMSTGASRQI